MNGIRVLTERTPDSNEVESRYVQAVGESGFTLLELVTTEDADFTPGDRMAVESEEIEGMLARLRTDWDDEHLRELAPLAPYISEALATTRHEAVRSGYVSDIWSQP